ncbi:hypothetical protein DIPPA_01344 [Diplonema papillatum]|nr:hypothetical protein DIPPA_01344 [Diplonema papillatum]
MVVRTENPCQLFRCDGRPADAACDGQLRWKSSSLILDCMYVFKSARSSSFCCWMASVSSISFAQSCSCYRYFSSPSSSAPQTR